MRIPPHPSGPDPGEDITFAELALATRNHGMPLEAMRWDLTPAGTAHPDEPDWSLGGCANDATRRVLVTVAG